MSTIMQESTITTITDVDTADRVPPITCPSWCVDGTGHADEFSRDDQWHRSQDHQIELSQYLPYRTWGGQLLPRYAWAMLQQSSGEATAVHIGEGDDIEIKMTPDEARRFAMQIMAVLTETVTEDTTAATA